MVNDTTKKPTTKTTEEDPAALRARVAANARQAKVEADIIDDIKRRLAAASGGPIRTKIGDTTLIFCIRRRDGAIGLATITPTATGALSMGMHRLDEWLEQTRPEV
jgi:hypothetical protein